MTLINNEKTVISPDFAPIEKETYAEVLNDEETSKLEQQEEVLYHLHIQRKLLSI